MEEEDKGPHILVAANNQQQMEQLIQVEAVVQIQHLEIEVMEAVASLSLDTPAVLLSELVEI